MAFCGRTPIPAAFPAKQASFNALFSSKPSEGQGAGSGKTFPFRILPDPQPLHEREYHYHFGDDSHDPFSTGAKGHHKEKRVTSENPRGVQDNCDPGVQKV